MATAAAVFLFAQSRCRILWTCPKVLYFAAALVSACLIRFGLIWIAGCYSFRSGGATNRLNYFVLTLEELARYLLVIYPPLLKEIFAYLIPYAFISYYPVGYLLGKSGMQPEYLLIFPVCALVLALSALTLKAGLARYESAGN